jgi:predicted GNAT superfamily acetyltransferase
MSDNFVDNPVERITYKHSTTKSAGMKFPLRTKVDAETRLDEEDVPELEIKIDRTAPLIRIAMRNDAKTLEKLAESVSLSKLPSSTNLAQSGFLVSGFDAKAYTKFINKAEHFLVLHVGSELVGFLLAYGSEHIDPAKEQLNMHIKDVICRNKKFVLIKQICISPKIEHRRQKYATMLYKELYARILHYYDHESGPRPVYTAIVKIPSNPPSLKFHKSVGFKELPEEFIPDIDHIPRYIYENKDPSGSLDNLTTKESKSESCAFYDSRAMADPHCIGIGVTMYSIGPPDVSGTFKSNVRIVMKWRQEGIEKIYPRKNDGLARTEIKIEDHENDPRTVIRLPRYDLNKDEVDQVSSYAYIDKNDPQDVITWQQVLRGTFSGELRNLILFPADLQELRFTFRIWDNDPDDRCRYFRQLHYADNTAWPLCVKRPMTSLSFAFLAPQAEIDVFEVSQTSRYTFKIPVLRSTSYYLRTVAFPLILISTLSFASNYIDVFEEQIAFNSALLLTTVAYLFITKDVTPDTSVITMLDMITYGSLVLSWALIMIRSVAVFDDITSITQFLCIFVTGMQLILYISLYLRYKYFSSTSEQLGDYN